jgi:hypothetical protein
MVGSWTAIIEMLKIALPVAAASGKVKRRAKNGPGCSRE